MNKKTTNMMNRIVIVFVPMIIITFIWTLLKLWGVVDNDWIWICFPLGFAILDIYALIAMVLLSEYMKDKGDKQDE